MRPLLLVLVASSALATPVDQARLARLFGFTGHVPTPVAPVTPLPFRLLGTLRAVEGASSLAALDCASRSTTVGVGDVVFGVEIVSIDQQELIVRRGGRLERLGRAPFVPGVAASGSGQHRLTHNQVAAALANPSQLMTQVRMVPAMVGGKWAGFRASYVQEGSLVASLGLKAGDVLRGVNGQPLDSPERLMALYQALQTSRRFEVELERGGQRVTQTIDLD